MDDNDAKQRDLGLYMATVLLTKCSEVWVFGRLISSGMAAEIYKAETRGMPIRYFPRKWRRSAMAEVLSALGCVPRPRVQLRRVAGDRHGAEGRGLCV